MEKKLIDLKSQLMEKAIQLDYRGMRLSELEKKLQETTPADDTENRVNHEDASATRKVYLRRRRRIYCQLAQEAAPVLKKYCTHLGLSIGWVIRFKRPNLARNFELPGR